MPEIIVTLPRRVFGLECLTHWLLLPGSQNGGICCIGCRSYIADRVSPVELTDDGEIDRDLTEISPLCKFCSVGQRKRIKAGWLTLTDSEAVELWVLVRREQVRDTSRELSRERDRATTLDDLQTALAALQEPRTDKDVDDSRKVA